jgi:putative phosphoesterase
MFRLGVVSDSHGDRSAIERVCPLIQGADAVVHLGDGANQARKLAKLTGLTVYAVGGNCDAPCAHPAQRLLVLNGVKTFITHGHLYGVKHSPLRLALRAREAGAGLALFGHTHAPLADWAGGVLLVNPGSLLCGQYALIELGENGPVPFLLRF